MATFKLQFMASDHQVYDGEAVSVTVPTIEGKAGILAHHSNAIMAIVAGTIEYVPAMEEDAGIDEQTDRAMGAISEGGRRSVVVSDGLAKVENNVVMILVDTAENPDFIDEARARKAEARARRKLEIQKSRRDRVYLEAALSRAISRINAAESRKRIK